MNNFRKKVAMCSLSLALLFGLGSGIKYEISYADNPRIKSSHHSITGGWEKGLVGNSGKHWTRYTQRNSGGRVYASIQITGYARETNLGNYTSAYVKSSRSVDIHHPHYHTGGMTW